MSKPIEVRTVGMIGVRGGLAYAQFQAVCRALVERQGPDALTGIEVVCRANDGWGDADFDRIVRWMTPVPTLVVPDAAKPSADRPTISPHDRNRAIVDASDLLIACPPVAVEEPRSRTWVAIRYARRVGKMVMIVYPDGTVDAGGRNYFMLAHRNGNQMVSVFVCHDPRLAGHVGLDAIPVRLETLPHASRFGHDGPATARPLLGRSIRCPLRYREFPSRKALLKAGFVPVEQYRVCDTWDDYLNPWLTVSESQSILDTGDGNAYGSTDPNGVLEAILREPAPVGDPFAELS
jgi:hypothetical protein